MIQKDPAFLFYSKDWIEGTADLMPDEKGVYIDLLAHQHQRGTLPCDLQRLARMVGLPNDDFMRIWSVIKCKFDQMDDQLVNHKLSMVVSERATRAKKNRISGTFASILRTLKKQYSDKKIIALRSEFKTDDFLEFTENDIEREITNWCTKWLTN